MLARLKRRFAARPLDKWFGLAMVGASSAFRLASSILIARFGGPELFAVYVSLLTVEVIVNSLLHSYFITPLISMAPGIDSEGRADFLRFALARNEGGAIFATAAVVAGAAIALPLGVHPLTYTGFCAFLLVWLLSTAVTGALSAEFRNARAIVADIIGFVIQFSVLFVAAANGWAILQCFFWAGFVGHGLALFFMHAGLPAGDEHAVPADVRARFSRFGRDVLVGSVANSSCSRVQPFVLGGVSGALAVSMFGAANAMIGPIRMFASALAEVLRPRLALFASAAAPVRAQRGLLVCLGSVLALVAITMVAFESAGPWLVRVVLGPAFVDVAEVLPWALLFAASSSLVTLVVVAMQTSADDGSAAASRLRVVVAIVSLLLVAPACALYGARGAFGVMSLAEVLFLAGSLRFLRHTDLALSASAP